MTAANLCLEAVDVSPQEITTSEGLWEILQRLAIK